MPLIAPMLVGAVPIGLPIAIGASMSWRFFAVRAFRDLRRERARRPAARAGSRRWRQSEEMDEA